jgi:integrase
MPSFSQRKTKTGVVFDVRFRIIDDSGIEIMKRLCGYPTKRAANQAYLEFMKTYVPPTFKLKRNDVYIFDDLFSIYRKKMEVELASSSFYDLNWIYTKYVIPFFTGKSLPKLKKADFAEWQTELWAKTNPDNNRYYTNKYLTKIRSTLNTFLSWCEETYDIPNLLKQIRKPKRKEMKKEMQFWELDEFLKFQAVCDNVLWKTFFMSLFYSGCRVGEILAITDKDVVYDGKKYSFLINKGLSRQHNTEKASYVIQAPKTTTSNRTVLLPDVMTEQINEYLAYKKELNQSGKFFFGGDAPIPQRTYQRYFAQYSDVAGLKHIRIHDLRHSHASMLIHLNVPITAISKRLGHSSVKMTLEKYAHCYASSDSDTIETINSAINIFQHLSEGKCE